MKFATKLIWHRSPHLRHVATIPCEIKYSNFCRYSADMEENANKLHLIASNFVIRPQILIFSVLKMGCLSPYWLLFFWLFTLAVNLWHRKCVTAPFVNNQYGIQRQGQDFLNVCVSRRSQQRGLQTHFLRNAEQSLVLISCYKRCGPQAQFTGGQKFEFLISQGSAATRLMWDGYCRMDFVANFIRFPAIQKVWKSVNIWRSYRDYKCGNFFETQCIWLYSQQKQNQIRKKKTGKILQLTITKPMSHKSSSWRWDTRTWRDVSSYLFTYLLLNYDTPLVP